jgi:hypothetical protein
VPTLSFQQICLAGFVALVPMQSTACTIVSGISSDGQVWTANNEDGHEGAAAFINVFPRSQKDKYGFFTLSYSIADAENAGIQGGMNETGLTFDFNEIKKVATVDRKKPFPAGDAAILRHILATMSSADEVVRFFDTYWFQKGFEAAQMHVADRKGRFAIISPSGNMLGQKDAPLVSTNFDLAKKEDGSTCWRYPIADKILKARKADLPVMVDVIGATRQTKETFTLYSNIQNLSTGDVWFFSKRDFNAPVKTHIADLLAKGRQTYSFDDLKALVEKREVRKPIEPAIVELPQSSLAGYAGSYRHPSGVAICVEEHEKGLRLSGDGNPPSVVYPSASNTFFWPKEDAHLIFEATDNGTQMQMSAYENGYRLFTAKRLKPKQ